MPNPSTLARQDGFYEGRDAGDETNDLDEGWLWHESVGRDINAIQLNTSEKILMEKRSDQPSRGETMGGSKPSYVPPGAQKESSKTPRKLTLKKFFDIKRRKGF